MGARAPLAPPPSQIRAWATDPLLFSLERKVVCLQGNRLTSNLCDGLHRPTNLPGQSSCWTVSSSVMSYFPESMTTWGGGRVV